MERQDLAMQSKNKIVVTGASGFVGSYLVKFLQSRGKKVEAFDIKAKAPIRRLNINYKTDVRLAIYSKTEAIVNLACRQPATDKRYNPGRYFTVNVEGLINILEVCKDKKIPRIISIMSYLDTLEETRYSKEYGLFSISEIAAMECLEFYNRNYGMNNVVVRVPPIIGYGSHLFFYKEEKLIKSGLLTFIEKAQRGEPIEVWGDAETPRYVIYIKDLVSLIEALIDSNLKGVINAASDFVSLKEEVQAITRVFSLTSKISKIIYKPEIPNSVRYYPLQAFKGEGVCNWKPKYNLKNTLIDIKKEMEADGYKPA